MKAITKVKFIQSEVNALIAAIDGIGPTSNSALFHAKQKLVRASTTKAKPVKAAKPKRLKSKEMKKLFKEITPKTAVFTKGEFLDKVIANIAAVNGAVKN